MSNMQSNNIIEFFPGWNKNINFDSEAQAFLDVLNSAKKENDVQRYIKNNQKWFIPASIFKNYDFGHHEAYIIPEQPLGTEYRADYMLVGRNSLGYHIVLVEFEDVNVDYKIKTSNSETEAVRKGFVQIRDWKRWIDENKDYFFRNSVLSDKSRNIPSWGIKYCLVVSRRNRMGDIENQMRRQAEIDQKVKIITYDRLVEDIRKLTNGF